MSLFLILFFVSLTGIIFMIGRNLLIFKHGEGNVIQEESFFTEILNLEKLKHNSIKNLKRSGHTLIWITLRTYIISSNFINKKRKELGKKIKEKIHKYKKHPKENQEQKEPSKYLKMISEYRQKIKRLKHKIKEEEGIE
jgi:hypothetical protein